MKHNKQDDMTASDFADNIQASIDQLELMIRTMKTDEAE